MPEKKQTEELLSEISTKLDKVLTVLSLNLVKDQEKQKDKIIALSEIGYGPTEISKMLNTTPGTAKNALNRLRKEKKKQLSEEQSNPEESVNVSTKKNIAEGQ